MAQLSTKIRKYAQANGISEIDFLTDVLLQDDGQGAYIKAWNLDITKPTDTQLNSYESEADLEERQNQVRATRKQSYGDIGEQLDMQYKDSINGTTTWKDHVQAIKDANPIPTE